jgi:hypothetical protein
MTHHTDYHNTLATHQAIDSTVASVAELEPDEVLAALARAEEAYRAARAHWSRELALAQQAQDELAAAEDGLRRAEDEARALRAELAKERERAARNRDRAARLAAALKDVHRALFAGNVY